MTYEYAQRSILAAVPQPGDTVLDVGAGVGYLSIAAAKVLGRDGAVHCVEADPHLIPLILDNTELSGVKLRVSRIVLGGEDGLVGFYIHRNFWSSSTACMPGTKRVVVEQREVNTFLRQLGPSMLIADIEGGEVALFRYIDLRPITRLCIEVHPETVGRLAISEVLGTHLPAGDASSTHDLAISRGNSLYFER